ncbi:SDR family NAD(P)-dependent oxidoreductase [Aurantimicrobium minutum]|uniref:SDR family NAD(P)-dependent oxidoreductase n=1 Tax=Aurantimicrobium minutum TaxID=708131 RepID=UPI002472FA4B|nr:SDR family oxidoreductase [Aurantimicrobium minutum]MDH6422980.1 short-subunit dehydrogenase [Aurantimicrobium minutum]
MEYTGKTALITGASSGIGVAYADGFAARGSNLILVARRKDRLEALATRLKKQYSVEVEVVPHDLTAPDAVAKLEKEIAKKKLSVDVLINNAGFGLNGFFVKEDRSKTQEEITLNIGVLVDLTAAFLPAMVQRNSGVVVNIASTASFQPVPGMAVYGATKAFVRSFTEALWGELGESKVRVLAVSPGSTESEFFVVAGGSPAGKAMPASAVVETTFSALEKNVPSVVVGGSNAFAAGLVRFFPKKAVIKLVGKMFLPKEK